MKKILTKIENIFTLIHTCIHTYIHTYDYFTRKEVQV